MGRARWAIAAAVAAVLLLAAAPAQAQDLYNCPDFVSKQAAQAWLDADPSDPHGLDADDDGEACDAGVGTGGTVGFPATATTVPPVTALPVQRTPGPILQNDPGACLPGLCTELLDSAPSATPTTAASRLQQIPRTGPSDVNLWLVFAAGALLFIGGNWVVAAVDLQRRR